MNRVCVHTDTLSPRHDQHLAPGCPREADINRGCVFSTLSNRLASAAGLITISSSTIALLAGWDPFTMAHINSLNLTCAASVTRRGHGRECTRGHWVPRPAQHV